MLPYQHSFLESVRSVEHARALALKLQFWT